MPIATETLFQEGATSWSLETENADDDDDMDICAIVHMWNKLLASKRTR